jgi:hypothetical protein
VATASAEALKSRFAEAIAGTDTTDTNPLRHLSCLGPGKSSVYGAY